MNLRLLGGPWSHRVVALDLMIGVAVGVLEELRSQGAIESGFQRGKVCMGVGCLQESPL